MNWKGVGILAAGAAALAAVTMIVIQSEKSGAAPKPSAYLLEGFADQADKAREIEITTSTGTLKLIKQNDSWVLPEKTGMEAKPDKVRSLLIGLAELKPEEPKTANPDLYSRIGVDEPEAPGSRATRVVVKGEGGDKLASLLVGIQTGRTGRFVRRPDDAQSYLADVSFDASTEVSLWLDRSLLKVDGSRISSVVVTHPDGEEFTVSRESEDEANFSVDPIPEGRELRTESIANPITRALTNLTFEDVRAVDRPLDDSTVTTVVYQTFDGLVVALRIGDEEGKRWTTVTASAVSADDQPEGLMEMQAKLAGRQFAIPAWAANNMTKHLTDLLKPVTQPGAIEPVPQGQGPVLDPGG